MEEYKKDYKEGIKYLGKGELDKAARAFEKAYRHGSKVPLVVSYHGMSAALRHGSVGLGLDLCRKAIKMEPGNAELYKNLIRVYLASGNKKGALFILRKALWHAPDDKGLNSMLVSMGMRKAPALSFLSHNNFINRFFERFSGTWEPKPVTKAGVPDYKVSEREAKDAAEAASKKPYKRSKGGKGVKGQGSPAGEPSKGKDGQKGPSTASSGQAAKGGGKGRGRGRGGASRQGAPRGDAPQESLREKRVKESGQTGATAASLAESKGGEDKSGGDKREERRPRRRRRNRRGRPGGGGKGGGREGGSLETKGAGRADSGAKGDGGEAGKETNVREAGKGAGNRTEGEG